MKQAGHRKIKYVVQGESVYVQKNMCTVIFLLKSRSQLRGPKGSQFLKLLWGSTDFFMSLYFEVGRITTNTPGYNARHSSGMTLRKILVEKAFASLTLSHVQCYSQAYSGIHLRSWFAVHLHATGFSVSNFSRNSVIVLPFAQNVMCNAHKFIALSFRFNKITTYKYLLQTE